MTQNSNSQDRDKSSLLDKVNQLRHDLRKTDPTLLAEKAGATFLPDQTNGGHFELDLWGKAIHLSYPELIAYYPNTQVETHLANQALLLYYLHTADGTQPTFRYIAFTELPDGMFYTQAFQGYSGLELARVFKDNRDVFEQAAQSTGGIKVEFGGVSYKFDLLPKVSLLVVFWQGDEDFPPSYRILFDAHSSHQMTTDACAILGSTLTRNLIKSMPKNYN